MSHVLTHHSLPGIDPRRLKELSAAGLESLEDVVDAGPQRLAELTGFDLKTCRALITVASAALVQQDPYVIELAAVRDEPASVRLARGLQAARRVERALSVVRKARSHTAPRAGRRAPRTGWARAHKKARKQLRKLLDRLEMLQQSVLSEGLSQISHDHLTGELDTLEASLQVILDQPVRKPALKRVRRLARTTRHALDARNA